jgi:HSP20 family protein
MQKDNRSFFQKLTGAIKIEDHNSDDFELDERIPSTQTKKPLTIQKDWLEDEDQDGELTVDVYNSGSDIVIKTMVAGVRPEDLDISITRDSVTIKGKRESEKTITDDDYFHQELYWGTFSRTIQLPVEVEVEEAEAIEKHGMLIIKLPKIDKYKQAKIKVRGN